MRNLERLFWSRLSVGIWCLGLSVEGCCLGLSLGLALILLVPSLVSSNQIVLNGVRPLSH